MGRCENGKMGRWENESWESEKMRSVPEHKETGIRMTKEQPSAVAFTETLTDCFGRKEGRLIYTFVKKTP